MTPDADENAIWSSLEALIVPVFRIKDKTLGEVLALLSTEIRRLKPELEFSISADSSVDDRPRDWQPRLTMDLHQVPATEVLHFTAELTNLSVIILFDGVVVLQPHWVPETDIGTFGRS